MTPRKWRRKGSEMSNTLCAMVLDQPGARLRTQTRSERPRASGPELFDHLVILHLGKVKVELADGLEVFGGVQADHLVGQGTDLLQRFGWRFSSAM